MIREEKVADADPAMSESLGSDLIDTVLDKQGDDRLVRQCGVCRQQVEGNHRPCCVGDVAPVPGARIDQPLDDRHEEGAGAARGLDDRHRREIARRHVAD